jgi:hypothetical protein
MRKFKGLVCVLLLLAMLVSFGVPALAATNPNTSPLITIVAQNGADGVEIRFSEAMNPGTFGVGLDFAKAWTKTWSADGKTLTLDGDLALSADKNTVIVYLMQTLAQKKDIVTPSIVDLPYAPALESLYAEVKDIEDTLATPYSVDTWAAFAAARDTAASLIGELDSTAAALAAAEAALSAAYANLLPRATEPITLVTPDKVTIKKGRTVKVPIEFNGAASYLAYTSGNAAVATVAGSGTLNLTVTGVKVGNAPITVRANDGSGYVKVFLAIVTA